MGILLINALLGHKRGGAECALHSTAFYADAGETGVTGAPVYAAFGCRAPFAESPDIHNIHASWLI